ncbi:MAG TPA: 2-oxo acid dehydrogenase subunit E2, partial [Chloroflexi bacterium]|nr:2-oxo acid dehydrogenase subunit E2 [Chloroflexota bacterium]
MAKELFIPKLGQTVEEVTLVKWLRSDGDAVKRGDEVLEVETDKAIFPVEANGNGVLHLGPYNAGDVLPILTVVAIIGKADEVFNTTVVSGGEDAQELTEEMTTAELVSSDGRTESSSPGVSGEKLFASPRAKKTANELGVDLSYVIATGENGKRIIEADVLRHVESQPKISPVAQKMAEAHGLDWKSISGSGTEGKIVKQDVQSALQSATVTAKTDKQTDGNRTPLTKMRRLIADKMAASVHTNASVTLVSEVDSTGLVSARDRLKAEVANAWGFAPGYNEFLIKITALTLAKYPYMNSQLQEEEIVTFEQIHIGIAVDTDRGLLVPVIRNADKKTLREIGQEIRDIAERARNNRILPDELEGGTFTITNLGMYDIDAFTPVINLPQAAILGVGKI